MARLRQQHPQNYTSSGNISTEFENLVRYLNAAELGNKTLNELLSSIFNAEGEFNGPIEMRYVEDTGVQYRIGQFNDAESGWETIVEAGSLRGAPGREVGTIGDSIFQSHTPIIATEDNQQSHAIAYDAEQDNLLIYHNGLLRSEGTHYSLDPTGGEGFGSLTLVETVTANDTIDIYKLRKDTAPGFRREEVLTTAPQTVFPFVHDANERVLVFRNGILKKEGQSHEYVADPATNTVTFLETVPSSNLITFIVVQNTAAVTVTGLMMEDRFVDPATGLILWNRIKAADGDIEQSKVSNLTQDLNRRAYLVIGSLTPENPQTGWFWLDTSRTPNQLKIYDGLRWLATSPESSLPSYSGENANQYARINGTGTGFEYGDIDLSSVVPKTQKGAANGVASLDSEGRIPTGQMPEILSQSSTVSTGSECH